MDPLSIIASVAGLIAAAGAVSSTIATIRSTLKNVPQSVNQIASEINDLTGSFSAVQDFLVGLTTAPRRRVALIRLDQLVATLTEAVLTVSELETLIAPYAAQSTIATLDRVKWFLKESETTPILERLQRHKSSLSLMLNIVQCESDLEAERCQVKLQNLVERLLDSNEDISRRLCSLEMMSETRSVLTTCFRNGKADEVIGEDCSDNLTITEKTQIMGSDFELCKTISREWPSRFTFEDDLKSSRVYSRTRAYKEDVSFTSSAIRTHAWSVFSGLSLGEISNISAIALPLYPDDISNHHWYTFGEQNTSRPDKSVIAQKRPLKFTKSSKFGLQYPSNLPFESPRIPPPIPRPPLIEYSKAVAIPTVPRDFEPCGATASMFLYARGNSIICVQHDTLAIERQFSNHTEQVQLLAVDNISESGVGRLVVSYDLGRTAIVWDLMTGEEVAKCRFRDDITLGTWMRNGNIAFANAQGDVILFEPSTSRKSSTKTIGVAITALAPGADSKIFAIGYRDGSLLIGNLEPRLATLHSVDTGSSPSPIINLAWDVHVSEQESDKLASQTRDGIVRVWSIAKSPPTSNDIKVMRKLQLLGGQFPDGPKWLGWAKNGQIVQHCLGKTCLWNRRRTLTYENVPTLNNIQGIAIYGPGATLFTLGPDNMVQQFDLNSPPQLVAYIQHPTSSLSQSLSLPIEKQKKLIETGNVSEIEGARYV